MGNGERGIEFGIKRTSVRDNTVTGEGGVWGVGNRNASSSILVNPNLSIPSNSFISRISNRSFPFTSHRGISVPLGIIATLLNPRFTLREWGMMNGYWLNARRKNEEWKKLTHARSGK